MRFSARVHVRTNEKLTIVPQEHSTRSTICKVLLGIVCLLLIGSLIIIPVVLVTRLKNKSILSTTMATTMSTTNLPIFTTESVSTGQTDRFDTSGNTTDRSHLTTIDTITDELLVDIFSTGAPTTALYEETVVEETSVFTIVTDEIETTTTTTTTTGTPRTTPPPLKFPANLLMNPGAEAGSVTGWTQHGSSTVIVDSGQLNSGYNPRTGQFCFAGGHGPGSPSRLSQTVQLLRGIQNFTAQQIDSGRLNARVIFYYQTYDTFFMRNDKIQVIFNFRTLSTTIAGFTTGELACSKKPGWCLFDRTLVVPIGTRSIDYTMEFYRRDVVGSAIDCYIDDNSIVIS